MRSLKVKTKLKQISVRTLISFFKKKSCGGFNFSVDTLFLNKHVPLKK